MKKMTIKEAVVALDKIQHSDPGAAHADADEILLSMVPTEVEEAYQRLVNRCKWWDTE